MLKNDIEKKSSSTKEPLLECDERLLPNLKKLSKELGTLPLSITTAERTFSTVWRLKTYLLNTTGEDRY